MEIRVLRYFLAVAREQSISGAAQALHLSQPTLSRQLMDLEDELGKQLMIRGTRRLTLTEEGVLLRKRAEEILDLVDKTEAEIKAADDTISGDVLIGAGETDAMRLIAKVAKRLSDEYPDIHTHVFSGNAEEVTEKLDKGLIDFGLLIEPVSAAKYESIRLPATDTWGALMRKDSPLAEKEFVEIEDLYGLPLICSKQVYSNPKEFSRLFKADVDKLNIISTYNLIFNASIMVEEGLGYALCLDKLIKTTDDGALCFRPIYPSLEVKLDVVWKKHQVFSKASELFLDRLREKYGGDKAVK